MTALTEKGWREASFLLSARSVGRWMNFTVRHGRAKDTASFTLKECGREAVTCDWMREFDACVVDPETGKEPAELGFKARLLDKKSRIC